MTRLEILKNSLEKKHAKFNEKLNEHFADVRSTNGQPLNDKRNGAATFKRWDRQNESLLRLQKEIARTEDAITSEEWKQKRIADVNNVLPPAITSRLNDGTLRQWGKHPNYFFVDGVEKARLIWDMKKKGLFYKYLSSVTDTDQRKRFITVAKEIYAEIENENNK